MNKHDYTGKTRSAGHGWRSQGHAVVSGSPTPIY